MANNNQFDITGICSIKIEAKLEVKERFVLVETNTELLSNSELIHSQFFEEEGEMNKSGLMALSNCFIQGLKASIDRGDKTMVWDKEEHFLYVIQELMRVFPLKTTIGEITEKEVSHEG